jgi:hypothetical protein
MTTPQPVVVSHARMLMIVACVLFVLAALSAGFGWSISQWCFGFGGFASACLARSGI